MTEEELYKTIHPQKYLRNFLETNTRPDGREFLEYRPTIINIDSISKAEGSALVKIGNTTVICGIKAELAEPDNTEPNFGFVVPNIDMTKLCSPKYRAVGVSLDAQIMNQTLYNILINSNCLDLTELCIAKGKLVWTLYCDLVCLDDDGSVLDVAVIALMTALKSLKLPKIDYDVDTKVIEADNSIKKSLNMKQLPITSTFMIFEGKYLLADPSADEEVIADTLVTVSTCDGELSYLYKPGGNSIDPAQFDSLIKQASNRERYVKALLQKIFEEK